MDNFITREIEKDLNYEVYTCVNTRFPPEPNGYLHLGHAKSIFLNYGIAEMFDGSCILRMDDTNPANESKQYVDSIIEDVTWLTGKKPTVTYASDYFAILHNMACTLIKEGLAYVEDLSPLEISNYRSDPTDASKPGKESPFRDRTPDENLDLFNNMRDTPNRCLRAKIDMASPNMNMRDPVLYRVINKNHHRTSDAWNVYPMYDFAHPFCDVIERITHSICTLEFEDHRPLYDWVVDKVKDKLYPAPRQIEFARLNIRGIELSKRKLAKLVGNEVDEWDDPRLPTIAGLRNRGYTPESIKAFCEEIGVAKFNGAIEPVILENSIRTELNKTVNRIMAVLDPIKVTITNYTGLDEIELENNPENPEAGSRIIPFSKYLYIERSDFMEEPSKKFFRLAPGKEVRLKAACIIRCNEVIKDEDGNVIELMCTYDRDTSRKVKGTIHWVSAFEARHVTILKYGNIYLDEECTKVNKEPNTKTVAFTEPVKLKVGERYQFFRNGYFYINDINTATSIVTLKDSWSKVLNK